MVGQPGRRRRRRVEHLSDEVVGEFVVAPGDDEQPGGESVLAARNHVLWRLLHQVGDDGRIERRAQHRGGAHQILDRLAGAPHAREHGRLQRARDGRVAGRQRAQRLDHEQRVPAGLAQDHVRHPGLPGGRGEALDRLRRQRAEVEPVGDAGQLVDHVRALLGADGRDHEQSARPGLPDQEVDELHAGQSGVLQVVQAEQHRAAIRERPDECRDGLEGAPPLDLGAAALGRQADAEDGGNVRHERGEGARVVARQLAQRRRRQHAHRGRERVDDRLQEQRPLRLVATGGQHGAAGRAGDPPELVAQPGLADARLARDDDQPGLPVGGLVPGVAQAPQLVAASHQAERLRPAVRRAAPRRRPAVLLAQHVQVQRLRLGCRVGAELGSEPITQLGVRHQCARRLTSASMSAHEGPAGGLVERIRRDRRLGSRPGQLVFTGGQRRLGQQVPRASDQVGQLAPGRLGPLRVRLVVQEGLRSHRVARPGRRGRVASELPSCEFS